MKLEIDESEDIISLNEGHIYEAIDRIHVATLYLHTALCEQSLIAGVDEFREQVDRSIEILSDLYQQIGNVDSLSNLTEKYSLREGFKVGK